MNRVLTLLLLLTVAFSCKESANRPVFTTGAVTVDPLQGTKLTLNISSAGDSPATDFGFIWSPVFPFGSSADSVFSFHTHPTAGIYTHLVQNDLVPGTTYYVVAFMKIGNSTIQGNTVKFSSAGSVAPIISDFTPKQ